MEWVYGIGLGLAAAGLVRITYRTLRLRRGGAEELEQYRRDFGDPTSLTSLLGGWELRFGAAFFLVLGVLTLAVSAILGRLGGVAIGAGTTAVAVFVGWLNRSYRRAVG